MRSSLPLIKLTALLVAVLTLLPLAACGNSEEIDPAATSSTNAPTGPAETESETEDLRYVCELDNTLDYENEEINFMVIQAPGRDDELISNNALGAGIVPDAVYTRNLTVENQLKVKFAYTDYAEDTAGQSAIARLVQAGDDSIDIFTIGTNWSVSQAIKGSYINLRNVDNIDLDKHYWTQDYNDMLTFTSENKQYLVTCPAAISLFRLTYLTIFNRDLLADRKITDLYETVENGDWTLDYQRSIVADIWTDTDADGKRSEDDFYGFITGCCISVDAYAVSSDISLIVRDETGYFTFDKEEANKMIDMADKVSALFTSQGTYYFPKQDQDHIGENYIIGKFASKEGLMATTQFLAMETNIDGLAALNYGIAPMPKLFKEQKDYKTYVQDQVTSFGISACISGEDRQDMLGAVLEAIAYHSNSLVRPAYYDSTLSLRFMQDPQSKDILNTMFETIAFDYCYSNGVGGIRDELRTKLLSTSHGVPNRIKGWERAVNNQIKRDNAQLDKLP